MFANCIESSLSHDVYNVQQQFLVYLSFFAINKPLQAPISLIYCLNNCT